MRIDVNRPSPRGEVDLDPDLLPQGPVEKVGHSADQLFAIDAFGQERLGAGEGQKAPGQRCRTGRALHRIVEVHHDLSPRTVQPAKRKIDPADDDSEHVVEVVGDSAGQLADGFHFLDLAQLGFGRFALGRFRFERLVCIPKLLGSLAYGNFKGFRALGLTFCLPARRDVLAQRLNCDDAQENGAEADDNSEPAQVAGELVGLRRKQLALLNTAAQGLPLGPDNLLELVVECAAGTGLRGRVEIADSGVALLGECGTCSEG